MPSLSKWGHRLPAGDFSLKEMKSQKMKMCTIYRCVQTSGEQTWGCWAPIVPTVSWQSVV